MKQLSVRAGGWNETMAEVESSTSLIKFPGIPNPEALRHDSGYTERMFSPKPCCLISAEFPFISLRLSLQSEALFRRFQQNSRRWNNRGAHTLFGGVSRERVLD